MEKKAWSKTWWAAPLVVTLSYALLGALWILVSDEALPLLVKTEAARVQFSIYKGWAFIAFTGTLLFLIIARAQKALRGSETKYRELIEDIGDLALSIDMAGRVTFCSGHIAHYGYRPEEVIGKPFTDLLHPDDAPLMYADLQLARSEQHEILRNFRLLARDGAVVHVEAKERFVYQNSKPAGIVGVLRDVTFRRQAEEALRLNEARLKASLHLGQMLDRPLHEITDFAMEAAVRLTKSKIGFLAFANDDETVLTMHSWSRQAMEECEIVNKPHIYPVSTAGLWAEALRQRKPIVTNDYAAPDPLKRGLPEGHVPLQRHLSVPVFEGTHVVAVAGVGNKDEPYGETDVRQLSLLMDEMWGLLQRQRSRQALENFAKRLQRLREIDQAILSAHSPHDIAQRTLDFIRDFTQSGRASLLLIDNQSQTATLLAVSSAEPTEIARGVQLPLSDLPFREILAKGQTNYLKDTRQTANALLQRMLREGFCCFFSVPLRVHDELIGALSIASAHPDAFTQEHQTIATEIASPLAVAIEQARLRERLQKQTAELEHRVLARTRELEIANAELESFSYSVSHDLRAPLRAIEGFSEAIADEELERLDENGRKYLERIRAAARRMGQLIADLLNLSRVTRGKMQREPVDLSKLAKEIAASLQNANPGRDVEFCIAPDLNVSGDSALLRILLENLLENAWKFTSKHPKARICLGSEVQAGQSVFYVMDDGAGFDMAYSNKLFGAFQRLHSHAEFSGTGIGLATVQRIVHRHSGRVWAEAKVEAGAKFFFTLPGVSLEEQNHPSRGGQSG